MKKIMTKEDRKRIVVDYDCRIGDAIAEIRLNRGLDQASVAEAFGCQQPIISKIEQGQRSVKVSEVGLLAEALKIPPERFARILLDSIDVDDFEWASVFGHPSGLDAYRDVSEGPEERS